MSEDLALATHDAREASPTRPAPFAGRGWLPPLLIVTLLALGWEGAKALLRIPDYKLPHLTTILSEFGERTQGGQGPIWAVLMLQNAAVTLGEALTGFVLGGCWGAPWRSPSPPRRCSSAGCFPMSSARNWCPSWRSPRWWWWGWGAWARPTGSPKR